MVAGPLQGIVVVDLTIWMSGAIASMLLGDLGADVIKIEGPTGVPVRRYVPIGQTDSAQTPDGVELCVRALQPEQAADQPRPPRPGWPRPPLRARPGRGCLHHQHAGGNAAGAGADEESIKSVNPAVVYARAGGSARPGPGRTTAARTCSGWPTPGLLFTASPEPAEPFAPPGATNDVLTGTMTAFGVLAALMQRQQSGTGETVRTSLLHTALWTQLIQFGTVANAPQLLLPARSRRDPRSPGVNQYKCSDGRWVAVAAVTADAWGRFVKAL